MSERVVRPADNGVKRSETTVNPWWTLVVLCLSLVIIVVGNTVLNIALPTLVRELDATSSELQWMVDSYALVFAGLLLTAGGMSATMAPATGSIMSSLPQRNAGVGSAWNDTTRELGGALGVAVLGSIAASQYVSTLRGSISRLPGDVRRAAEASVGGAM